MVGKTLEERAKSTARWALDTTDRLRGRLIPPRRLRRFTEAGDYESVGTEFLGHLVELGGVARDDRVLDVGSGIGRLAIPLSGYLQPDAAYVGVDVWAEGVDWCRRNITPRFPNFQFRHIDWFDAKYNPTGARTATGDRLPFADASFDFAIMVSILHLNADRVRSQLLEIGRTLCPGGTVFSSWWLPSGGTTEPPGPGPVITESEMRSILRAAGLDLRSVHYGRWAGRTPSVSLQDIVIAAKPS